jgi:hypothetical protein
MLRDLRIVFMVACCLACGGIAAGQGSGVQPKPKAKVELRWVESKRIEGVTEDKGFQTSCDPKDISYPHKRPALVLTSAEVSEARLTNLDLSRNGLSSENYTVTMSLTNEAREKLAASCEGSETRWLTVVVDGTCTGVCRYERGRKERLVPESYRAETFQPSVGMFSSKAQAQRIVDGVR